MLRLSASALLRWAALVAVFYAGALGAWQWTEPVYLRALERGVTVLRAAGLLPGALQAVIVPDQGLAVIGTGVKGVAVPQRILGADLALAVALMLSTPWLSWRLRALRAVAALGFVFVLHLMTIAAQTWANTNPSTGARDLWTLWTALYQGKVVPIMIWGLLVGLPKLRSARGGRVTTPLAHRAPRP